MTKIFLAELYGGKIKYYFASYEKMEMNSYTSEISKYHFNYFNTFNIYNFLHVLSLKEQLLSSQK